MKLRAGSTAVAFLSLVVSLAAQTSRSNSASVQVPPPLIQFSEVATDQGGNTLSGVVSITFSLFGQQRGGEALWSETQKDVQLDPTGHYSVQLGSTKPEGVPATLFATGEARWLGVQIADQTEPPRVLLVSVPYALKAGDATTVGGFLPSAFVRTETSGGISGSAAGTAAANPTAAPPPLSGSGITNYVPLWTSGSVIGNSVVFQSGGNIGVGTQTPGARITGVGASTGIHGSSAGAFGVGVFGTATATSGNGTGVYGQTLSPGAAGVVGVANIGGFGLIPTGVYGVSNDPDGAGVGGAANATSGHATGVIAASSSTSGTGVAGFSIATSGNTYGVTGSDSSPSGIGMFGQNSASSGGRGVVGISYSASGGIGVVGANSSPDGGAGVFMANAGQGLILQGLSGSSQTQVFTVDAAGNLDISGNLTVSGSKSARVKMQDGREVALYAVESPENWFEDFGTGTLHGGAAEVALDPGFRQTVNTAETYHVFLTPNGDCRGLYVASKSPGLFLVRELGGGNASVTFDYRIVARRRDFENVRLKEVHLPPVSQQEKALIAPLQRVGQPLIAERPLTPKIATGVLAPR